MNLLHGITLLLKYLWVSTTYRYITNQRVLIDTDPLNHFLKIPTVFSYETGKKNIKPMVCQTITSSNLKKLHNKLYTCIKHEQQRSITSYVFPVHLFSHPNGSFCFQKQFYILSEGFFTKYGYTFIYQTKYK